MASARTQRLSLVSVIMLAAVIGVTLAAMQRPEGSRPTVVESSTATANGVTMGMEAQFSGTETIVQMSAKDSSGLPFRFLIAPQNVVALGFLGSFDGGPTAGEGVALARFPAIAPGAEPIVLVSALTRFQATGQAVVKGPWQLRLAVPAESMLEELLRVDDLGSQRVSNGDIEFEVSARKSTSSLELAYQLPPGVRQLMSPVRIVPGKANERPSHMRQLSPGEYVVSFPTAGSQAKSDIEWGPFSRGESQSATARIALGAKGIEPPGVGLPPLKLPVLAVLDGDPGLVSGVSIETALDGVLVLGVNLTGNWPSDLVSSEGLPVVSWVISDATGREMPPRFFGENYTKAIDGTLGYGNTSLGVAVALDQDLSHITVATTRRAVILPGKWRASF